MDKIRIYPSDWTPKALGKVCAISIGGTPSRDQDRFWAQGEDGYPWVAISDMGPKLITKTNERITEGGVVNSNAKSVRAGTILMSFKLTLGRMGIAGIDLYTNEAIAAFVPKSEDVNSKWLYHFLPRLALSATAEQAIKGQTLNKKKLNILKAYLPSIPEQRRIAEILDTIDEAIQKTEALISKLKAMKQGLLHDLLTRGLDKNGKLRDPKAHPEQFKDSPLGRIPREWKVGSLSSLAISHDNRRVPLKQADRDKRHGIYPYYGASGIIDWIDDYLFDGDFVLLGEDGENVVSRELPLAFRTSGRFWVNNHAHVFEPLPEVNICFLTELLEFTQYKKIIIGSAQPKITQDGLKRLLFRIPEIDEQAMIAEKLENHDTCIRTEEQYRDKLKLQKKGLMHDLLTGKVRVKM